MAINDETITGLRAAAISGDAQSAYELARLLCLVPFDPADRAPGYEGGQSWPEEHWSRAIFGEACFGCAGHDPARRASGAADRPLADVLEYSPDAAEHDATSTHGSARRKNSSPAYERPSRPTA
ncbi:hypothetical protein ABZY19_35685 [Streptomyces sp. NPDC006475]|uniref:hypothetical protein n=1 Tax=Streptomyces sp. NPDC006475 TaxID=3155719 RepID=UPI0033A4F4CB